MQDPVTAGPYRIIRKLGEGGMGVVYLAADPAGHHVALKVLRAHVTADDEARVRLRRELNSLRRVRHRLLAQILDADLDAPQPYLVTRFVPGRSLHDEVYARGPFPPGEVARVGRGLAEALGQVHAAGIVHRDIKPANIMMDGPDPVIIDFGLAHTAGDSRITRTGLVMGTPGYVPPEVIYGTGVTPATDWWAWGATLAFVATGRPPFGTGRVEVVFDRVRRGQCDLEGVHPRVERILRGALAVDPARRPSAAEILDQLDPSLALASPGTAGPSGPAGSPGVTAAVYGSAPRTPAPRGEPDYEVDAWSPEPERHHPAYPGRTPSGSRTPSRMPRAGRALPRRPVPPAGRLPLLLFLAGAAALAALMVTLLVGSQRQGPPPRSGVHSVPLHRSPPAP